MEFEKSIPFKNWLNEDFTGRFGGIDYKFSAGATYNVPTSQAAHFAKQMAVHALHTMGYEGNRVRGEMLSDQDVLEYSNRCYPSVKPGETENAVGSFDRIDDAPSDEDANGTEDEEKGNDGPPKFKVPVAKKKTKDAEYK